MSEVSSNWQDPVQLCAVSPQYDEGFRDGVSESKRLNAEDFDAQRLRADTAEAELAEMTTSRDYCNRVALHNKELGVELERKLAAVERRISELEKDAARYQWLRDRSQNHHQFYLSTPLYFTGVKFSKDNVDRAIDAALNPNHEAESHE